MTKSELNKYRHILETKQAELEAFVRSAAAGTPVTVSGEHGTAALELAHQVLEAIEAYMRRHDQNPGTTMTGHI